MLRGIYAAGSGLLTQNKVIDVAGNNMANASTAGFKRDGMTIQSFGERMVSQLSASDGASPIGDITHGSTVDQVFTSYEQGTLESTGRGLDMAIVGDGFFTLRMADNSTVLSRNGHFAVNKDGYLTDTAGNLVLGESGPIKLESTDFTVSAKGEILAGEDTVGTLKITVPTDVKNLIKLSDSLFQVKGGTNAAEFQGKIQQGYLESSNVDVTAEMTDMISASRSFQSCSQVLKIMDQVLAKSVSELGKV